MPTAAWQGDRSNKASEKGKSSSVVLHLNRKDRESLVQCAFNSAGGFSCQKETIRESRDRMQVVRRYGRRGWGMCLRKLLVSRTT